MLSRRVLLSAPLAALPLSASAGSRFPSFLHGLKAEAQHAGISPAMVDFLGLVRVFMDDFKLRL